MVTGRLAEFRGIVSHCNPQPVGMLSNIILICCEPLSRSLLWPDTRRRRTTARCDPASLTSMTTKRPGDSTASRSAEPAPNRTSRPRTVSRGDQARAASGEPSGPGYAARPRLDRRRGKAAPTGRPDRHSISQSRSDVRRPEADVHYASFDCCRSIPTCLVRANALSIDIDDNLDMTHFPRQVG